MQIPQARETAIKLSAMPADTALPILNAPPATATSFAADAESSTVSTQPAEHARPAPVQGEGPTVYLETFGCQMNTLDSQLVRGQLLARGYRFVQTWQTADIVLYNTCSVREVAENKVWSRIGKYKKNLRTLAADGQDTSGKTLGVIGCMAERDGVDLMRRHPQVDLLCGPGELDKIPLLLENTLRNKRSPDSLSDLDFATSPDFVALQGNTHRRSSTLSAAADQLELVDLSRSFVPDPDLAAGKSAYVRITRGCNKLCTYCVVPQTRGAEVHRPPLHIIEECKKLADAGVLEITLLGQTVNHYHYDTAATVLHHGIAQPQVGTVISPNAGTGGPSPVFNSTTVSFADLLAQIHDRVPALQRIRFVTSLPRDFGDDILAVIRDHPRLCQYLHLPVQSGSNRILKRMNRGYKVEQYDDLIDRVRSFLPHAELATDIICGFPTETEADHQQTADLLRRCRFKNSFIFKYSPRPGTLAIDRFDDDVPTEIKKRRNNELLDIQSEISAEIHQAYVGRTVPVFVERLSARIHQERQPRRRQGHPRLAGARRNRATLRPHRRRPHRHVRCPAPSGELPYRSDYRRPNHRRHLPHPVRAGGLNLYPFRGKFGTALGTEGGGSVAVVVF